MAKKQAKKKVKAAAPKKKVVKAAKKPVKKIASKPAKKAVKLEVKKPPKAKVLKPEKAPKKVPLTKEERAAKYANERSLKPIAVYLGIGSNVGDREEYIEQAITLLKETKEIKFVRRSSNYETKAVGGRSQAPYINSTAEISTKLGPSELLETLQSMEDTLGRERGLEWGPRTIDIDILLYGSSVISEDNLSIPHPLMHERMFVLEPLKEIAPHINHPVLERTINELYLEKKNSGDSSSDSYDEELGGFKEMKRGISDDYERW